VEAIMKKFIGIMLLSWLWSVHALAIDAGWINHFDGKPENYLFKRGNETMQVSIFTVLEVGDEISVNDKQHSIELSLRGGTYLVQVTYKNSPFRIDNANQVSSSHEWWESLKQHLDDWNKLTQPVRPKEITMPLLENLQHPSTIVAGVRSLHLQWYGGKPPYQVQIKQGRRRVLFTHETFNSVIETEPMTFDVNKSYRVVIFDADNQKFTGGFITIASIPNYPKTLLDVSLPDNFRQILQATWIAIQADGKWVFEAYQLAAKLIPYQPAQLLKEALAQGQNKQVRRGIRG